MLKLKDISKTFKTGGDKKAALDHLSLDVRPDDFITVIGANGAGKSTMFAAICGSYICDEGEIILDGRDITMLAQHKRAKEIGILFQDPLKGTAPGLSVEENLALAAGHGGWLSTLDKKQKNELREHIAQLEMGLEDRMHAQVGLLSGGQRQALTLMMATINAPKILLLDEHTAALDPRTAEKVLDITKKIVAQKKLTCLMITHNMASALELGNRTVMMHNGHIITDIRGEERAKLGVPDLLEKFREAAGKELDNDRMLLID